MEVYQLKIQFPSWSRIQSKEGGKKKKKSQTLTHNLYPAEDEGNLFPPSTQHAKIIHIKISLCCHFSLCCPSVQIYYTQMIALKGAISFCSFKN